ncbi:MAG: hypothetical protein H0U55_00235 [Rubrobacteraceae bacterium]|nr:hypothetical protein [Rubrobacteraceae bacterium]
MEWLIANYYQSVANDPPRDDFDLVWESDADLDESQVPASEPEATLHRFAARALLASDAKYALYIAMERYDGALEVGNQDAADSQARAAEVNAAAAASHQDVLASLAPSVNDIASSQMQDSDRTWDSVTIEEAQAAYIDACGADKWDLSGGAAIVAVAQTLTGTADVLTDLLVAPQTDLEHPLLDATTLPTQSDFVIGQDYLDALSAYSAALGDLVTP